MEERGKRIARVLMSNEVLALILRGEMDVENYFSDAPKDLQVEGASWYDPHTIVVWVASNELAPVLPGGIAPILDIYFTRMQP